MKHYYSTSEINADGLAFPQYSCAQKFRYWRFHEETIKLPLGAVPEIQIVAFHTALPAAKIEDVRAAHG